MKHITLTPLLAEQEDVTLKKQNKDIIERWNRFCSQTLSIINVGVSMGLLRYQNVQHFKRIKRALKALQEYKTDSDIYLEDSDYRELWGNNGQPGFIQGYGAWMQNDASEEYIDAWDNAKDVSMKDVQKSKLKA